MAALAKTERGKKFIAERIRPYQREFGWAAVWVHEFTFPTQFEDPAPFIETVKGYIETDYDYPSHVKGLAEDIKKACAELVEGLEGEARAKVEAANAINLKMAPLTPDHHFYIDQSTNAHLRLVLICIGKKLVKAGLLDGPEDVMYLRYNELRYLIGDPTFAAKPIVAAARAAYKEAEKIQPRGWLGTATESQLAFPYLGLWGFPEKLYIEQAEAMDQVQGLAASPGVVEGVAKVVMTIDEFDKVEKGDILVCQMTNPAWVTLFTKISGLVTDAGGPVSHPGVLSREFGIPAVVGSSVGTQPDQGRRPDPRQRVHRPGRDPEVTEEEMTQIPSLDSDHEPIARQVLSAQVKDRILQWILEGELAPGSRIVETRVARRLGTSQAPVREALRDLATLGFVEIQPYQGSRVREPSTRELREAIMVRGELEALAGRLAAPVITEACLERLESLMADMADAAERNDPHEQALQNAEFHAAIVEAAANRSLERLWRMLEPFGRTYVTASLPGIDLRWLGERHRSIIDALRAHDPERSAATLREHAVEASGLLAHLSDGDHITGGRPKSDD